MPRFPLDSLLQCDTHTSGIHALKPTNLIIEHGAYDRAMTYFLATNGLHCAYLAEGSDQLIMFTGSSALFANTQCLSHWILSSQSG